MTCTVMTSLMSRWVVEETGLICGAGWCRRCSTCWTTSRSCECWRTASSRCRSSVWRRRRSRWLMMWWSWFNTATQCARPASRSPTATRRGLTPSFRSSLDESNCNCCVVVVVWLSGAETIPIGQDWSHLVSISSRIALVTARRLDAHCKRSCSAT